jgi:hypothetical protein
VCRGCRCLCWLGRALGRTDSSRLLARAAVLPPRQLWTSQHACRSVWVLFTRPCMPDRRLLCCPFLYGSPPRAAPHRTTVGRLCQLSSVPGGASGRAQDNYPSQQLAGQLTSSPVSVSCAGEEPGSVAAALCIFDGILACISQPQAAPTVLAQQNTTAQQPSSSRQGVRAPACMARMLAHTCGVCAACACTCNREPCTHLLPTEVAATAAAGAHSTTTAAAAAVQQHQHDRAPPQWPAAHLPASSRRWPQPGPPQHDTPVSRG